MSMLVKEKVKTAEKKNGLLPKNTQKFALPAFFYKIKRPEGPVFWIMLVILTAYSAIFVSMLTWAFISTFKDYYFDFARDNVSGLPTEWIFTNYETVIDYLYDTYDKVGVGTIKINAFGLVQNTLLYTIGCALAQAIAPCITAYAVAKFGHKFKWLNIFTYLVIATMIIPIVGSTPSEMEIAINLGLFDQIWGMWILKFNFLGMYYLVFLGIFKGIPKSFEEAATIDGASYFQVFTRIHMPLAITTVGTILLIKTVEFWNDYQTPVLYLETKTTLSQWYFLFSKSNEAAISFIPTQIAGAMILVMPILILFILLNKRLMGNISLGGVKE